MKRFGFGVLVTLVAVLAFTSLRGGLNPHRPVRSIDELAQRAGCSESIVRPSTKPAVQTAFCRIKGAALPVKLMLFSDSAGLNLVLNQNAGHVTGLGANWLVVGVYGPRNAPPEALVTVSVKKATRKAGGSVIP